MYSEGTCLDFAFMDDGHRFDENMVELYFINKMLKVGGVLIIDDVNSFRSVNATVSFIETNLPYVRFHLIDQLASFVKVGKDKRHWSHFKSFDGFQEHTAILQWEDRAYLPKDRVYLRPSAEGD